MFGEHQKEDMANKQKPKQDKTKTPRHINIRLQNSKIKEKVLRRPGGKKTLPVDKQEAKIKIISKLHLQKPYR